VDKILIKFFLFQILQNLGKADKTTDEIFEEHLHNFNTQQVRKAKVNLEFLERGETKPRY
jgi:hypothetical protein